MALTINKTVLVGIGIVVVALLGFIGAIYGIISIFSGGAAPAQSPTVAVPTFSLGQQPVNQPPAPNFNPPPTTHGLPTSAPAR